MRIKRLLKYPRSILWGFIGAINFHGEWVSYFFFFFGVYFYGGVYITIASTNCTLNSPVYWVFAVINELKIFVRYIYVGTSIG